MGIHPVLLDSLPKCNRLADALSIYHTRFDMRLRRARHFSEVMSVVLMSMAVPLTVVMLAAVLVPLALHWKNTLLELVLELELELVLEPKQMVPDS